MNERSYLLDELGDPDAPIGSRLWSLWLANEIRKALHDKHWHGGRLQDMVNVFLDKEAWTILGHDTWEECCQQRFHTSPLEFEKQVTLRANTQARAMNAIEIDFNGRPKKGVDKHLFGRTRGSTNADYLTARIARDRPDILERMKQGEFRSVRQAAIAAGIPVQGKRLHIYEDNPAAAGRYLAERVDRAWLEAMIAAYDTFAALSAGEAQESP